MLPIFILCGLKVVFGFECPMEGIRMSKEVDKNYYEPIYRNVGSFELCGTFCARSEKCRFWTWYEDGDDSIHNSYDCLLFESSDQIQNYEEAYSGERNCMHMIL